MARPRRLQPDPDKPDCPAPFHGDENAYFNALPPCRCPSAIEARRLYIKRGRENRRAPGMVSSLGTVRRVQALQAMGHTTATIAGAGLPVTTVKGLLQARPTRVTVRTAAKVQQIYEALSGVGGMSAYARTNAERHGWPAPHEWWPGELDDPDADPRATASTDRDDDGDIAALLSAAKYRGIDWSALTLRDQERVVEGAARPRHEPGGDRHADRPRRRQGRGADHRAHRAAAAPERRRVSWPDAVEDCWPDDHTREAEELYQRVRREAQAPVPEPKAEWSEEGPTAQTFDRHLAQRYLYPRPSQRRRVA